MKSLLFNLVTLFSFSIGAMALGGSHPFSFTNWNGTTPFFMADSKSNVGLANEAFLTKYGAETGVMGTLVGPRGELVVVVMNYETSHFVWRKMIGAGDAYSANNGLSYILFDDNNMTPFTGFTFAGQIQVKEGSSERLLISNGTPSITRFLVAMNDHCIMGQAGVVPVSNMTLLPTKLVGSKKSGASTMVYEYSVNGGAGAMLTSISVSLGIRHILGLISDYCPVDIYVKY